MTIAVQIPAYIWSNWRSAAGYQAMMAWYDNELDRLTVPVRSIFVPTRHGPTHVIAAGPENAPPVVLLHGMSGNAMMWRSQLAALASRYRVYAPDVIGQSGRSAPTRPWKAGMGYAEWVNDMLDGLGIPAAHFVGISNGGWLLLKFATLAPQRITSAVLLSSAGFLPVSASALTIMAMLYSAFVLLPSRSGARRFAEFMTAPGADPGDEIVELMYIVLRYHRHQAGPQVIRSGDLAGLQAPVLLLMGEHESLFDPRAVIDAAHRALPNLTASEIFSDAGHSLTYDRADDVNARIMAYLDTAGTNGTR